MAVTTDNKVQFTFTINGEPAKETLKNLERQVAIYKRELKNAEAGTKEFEEASEKLSSTRDRLDEVNKAAKGVGTELKGANKIFGAFGIDLDKITGGLDEFAAKGGLAGNTVGFINGAIKLLLANPIVLFIALIVAAFVKLASATDFIKDKIEQFTGGIGNVIQFLTNAVASVFETGVSFQGFGDLVKNVFTILFKPVQDFITLLGGVGRGLLALVKGDFKGVQKAAVETGDELKKNQQEVNKSSIELANGFANLTGQIKAAYDAGVTYTQALQDIGDEEDRLNATRAETDRIVTAGLIQAKNKTLSFKEQLGLYDQIGNAEKNQASDELKNAQARVEAVKNRNASLTKLEDAQRKELFDAEAALSRARQNSDNVLEKIQNRRDAAIEANLTKQKQAADKAFAAEQANAKNRALLLDDELKKNLALFDAEAVARLRTAKQNGENIPLLEKVINQERLKIVQDFNQKKIDEEEKFSEEFNKVLEDQSKKEKEETDKRLKAESEVRQRFLIALADLEIIQAGKNSTKLLAAQLNKLEVEKKLKLENENLTNEERLLIEAQYQQKVTELTEQSERQRRERVLGIASEFLQTGIQAIVDFSKIGSDKQIADEEKTKNQRIKKLDAELKAKKISQEQYNNSVAAIEAQAAEKSRAIKRKQAEKEKAASLAQAIIAGALAVIKALPNIPLSILAGVTAGLNIGKIIATPIPEFAKGGIAQGASHSQGGIKMLDSRSGRVVGEMEGGEPYMILSKNTYANNRDVIDSLLKSSTQQGGRSIFAEGGIVNPDRLNANTSDPALLAAVNGLRADIQSFNGRLRAFVVLQDIEDQSDILNTIRNDSSFS